MAAILRTDRHLGFTGNRQHFKESLADPDRLLRTVAETGHALAITVYVNERKSILWLKV